jgi:hypothetical protein
MYRVRIVAACAVALLASIAVQTATPQPVAPKAPSRAQNVQAVEPALLIARGELRGGQNYAPLPEQIEVDDARDDWGPPAHTLPPPQQPQQPQGGHGGGKEPPSGTYGQPGGTQQGGGTPDPLAPRSGVFDPVADTNIPLGNDPQLAVGKQYLIGIEAHTIVFYDKKTGKPLSSTASQLPSRMPSKDFFALFLNPTVNGKRNPDDVNRKIANDTASGQLHCDPDNTKDQQPGCVREAYDTRVLFDRDRGKFWIVSALRNDTQTDDGNCDPKKWVCVPEDSPLKQRFIAVAVSRTGDPRDGFCEFLTALRRPGDWPRMAVHGRFLVLGSNGHTDITLLDADKLAKLDANKRCAVVDNRVGLGSYTGSDFGDPDHMYPVIQHDKRNESNPNAKPFIPVAHAGGAGSSDVPTFLIATAGSRLTVFAFAPSAIDQPQQVAIIRPALSSSSIDLGDDAPSVRSPPVYRNGKIFLTGDECVDGSGSGCLHRVRIIVVPVFRVQPPIGSTIVASNKTSLGFENFTIGGGQGQTPMWLRERVAGNSFEIPAIDVNKNGDFAVVYDRAQPWIGVGVPPLEPGVTYSIFYRAEHQRRDGILQAAICNPTPAICPPIPSPISGHLDVAGISIDPSDDTTVWMSHGFGDGRIGKYRMVIGKVQLRSSYVSAQPHPR